MKRTHNSHVSSGQVPEMQCYAAIQRISIAYAAKMPQKIQLTPGTAW
jgi:hypothetical protein